MRGSHTAYNLAEVVADVLKEFNLTGYLLCITADNAIVNDKLFKVLERLLFRRLVEERWPNTMHGSYY